MCLRVDCGASLSSGVAQVGGSSTRGLARAVLSAVGFWVAFSLLSGPAEAAKFGSSERLHVIAPTELTHEGKRISLCYKASTFFIVAGVYTTDEYVLCEGESSKTYWPMPVGEQLATLQQQGLIPSPLPPYARDTFDYVLGYSLWLLLVLLVPIAYFSRSHSKSEASRNLDALKTAVRRVMARIINSAKGGGEEAVTVALQVYEGFFSEPLPEADFRSDLAWVRDEAAACDGYLGAMGRKLDHEAKALLLRTAALVALADGGLDSSEEEAIRQIAARLAVKPDEIEKFLQALRRPADAAPTAVAAS